MATSEPELISVVIVTHRRPKFLAACLESVSAQDYLRKEIVVVVNPADDESEAVALSHGAKVVRTHRNLGFFPALNIGIANGSGNLVMIVDDDATFQQNDALSRLSGHLAENPSCMVVTCNISGPCEGVPYSATRTVHVFKTGFALIRREVFTRISGYVPDTFFRAGGETYLSNYVYEAGYNVMVRHDVWMHHAQTGTGRSSRAMNHYAVRNHALIVLLQEPPLFVLPSLAAKLLSSFLRIAIQRRDFLSWATGWFAFGSNSWWALRNRRSISRETYQLVRQIRRGLGASAKAIVAQSGERAS
jgi:GT2 family glycosyltransferase